MGSEPLVVALPQGHPLARLDKVPVGKLENEPSITYPSHFRSVIHDAVAATCAEHGFSPTVAMEVGETATLVSFVAADAGIALVPASAQLMTVGGRSTGDCWAPRTACRGPRSRGVRHADSPRFVVDARFDSLSAARRCPPIRSRSGDRHQATSHRRGHRPAHPEPSRARVHRTGARGRADRQLVMAALNPYPQSTPRTLMSCIVHAGAQSTGPTPRPDGLVAFEGQAFVNARQCEQPPHLI
jgi:hypothetical protein